MIKRLLFWLAAFGCITFTTLQAQTSVPGPQTRALASVPSPASSYRAVLDKYCVTCHSDRLRTAGLTLEKLDVGHPAQQPEVWEKVVLKLRTNAMPPAGRPRPDKNTSDSLSSWLETELDTAAVANPRPGTTTIHRLNRAEYANAIRDLLGLEIDGESLLPVDSGSYGFDNIADALSISPALMQRYLSAATEISRVALGRMSGSPSPRTYSIMADLDQSGRVGEDLPFGSRGGMTLRHYFPVDGEYLFQIKLQRTETGPPRGMTADAYQLEVRLDGLNVQTLKVGGKERRGAYEADQKERGTDSYIAALADEGLEFRLPVKAGSRAVGVAFIQQTTSLIEDLVDPGLRGENNAEAPTGGPDVGRVTITGPFKSTGAEESTTRRRILLCRPASANDESRCARTIVSALARRAYRRPVTDRDLQTLLTLYRNGQREAGFELGIEMALRGILVNPQFLFRFQAPPVGVMRGKAYQISDLELASRLSFFLWSSIPDDELLDLAAKGRLRDPAVLEEQVRRLLADDRSKALVSNFAGQWLQLRNVPLLKPSPEVFVRFDDNLRRALLRESELFFQTIIAEDRSILDLLDADYTFVDERLARHYGIPNVHGDAFRRITLPADSVRRGLLGQGALLLVTSHANRTSPVLRGKWILDNIFGTPPPPPPPDVPALNEQPDNDGKLLPMRERMAQHRSNPVCAACHTQMDQLGFALENFDATGKWRIADESETPIDASGVLPDGAQFRGPVELRKELLKRSDAFVFTVTQKLLTYGLGRGVDYYDAPAVRQIKREAARNNYRFSSLIMGIVKSTPFQMSMPQERGSVPLVMAVPRP